MTDLRPISITAIFSRVMESFLSKWIFRDLVRVIDVRQFGNVPGSSTTHYLASLIDTIMKGTDKQGMCASICVRLISLKHSTPGKCTMSSVRKLIEYGVLSSSVLPTICSFLSNSQASC